MAASLKWNGAAFEQQLRKATADGMVRAGTFYHAQCRDEVSTPNSGVQVQKTKAIKGRTRNDGKTDRRFKQFATETVTVYPSPSQPGEAPRLRTGFGQRNIIVEFDRQKIAARVGVTENGMYMFWLDIGTSKIARRPWLVATLKKHLKIIRKLAVSR